MMAKNSGLYNCSGYQYHKCTSECLSLWSDQTQSTLRYMYDSNIMHCDATYLKDAILLFLSYHQQL